MKKLYIFLLFMLNICYAAEWVELKDKFYVDITSFSYDLQNNVYFWTKHLRQNPKDKIDGRDYWYTKMRNAINCENRSFKIDTLFVYDMQNKVIGSLVDSNMEWTAIAPGSEIDFAYRELCSINNSD